MLKLEVNESGSMVEALTSMDNDEEIEEGNVKQAVNDEVEDGEESSSEDDDMDESGGDVSPVASAKKEVAKEEGNKQDEEGNEGKKETKKKTKTLSKSYVEYIHEAIVGLNNRAGSSLPAITKFLLSNYPELDAQRVKARLAISIKAGIKAGRFEKVRASFKIKAEWKKKIRDKKEKQKRQLKAKLKEKQKKKDQEQKKQEEAAAKEEEAKLAAKADPLERQIQQLLAEDPESNQKLIKQLRAEQRKKIQQEKKKKEQELYKQQMLERMKKRRFPMEDTLLHAQDKEFGIKPPKDVSARPNLPSFFKKIAAAKCDNLDSGSRGLVPDLLQVYHFFCGDVHYNHIHESIHQECVVPKFTLKNLIYAAQEIINGNAKKSRLIPPLIVHLFCACLRLLLNKTEDEDNDAKNNEDDPYSVQHRKLKGDFELHLAPALSPASWADVCHMYMDAMERFYTTEASVTPNVLPGLPIDAEYLLYLKDDNKYGDNSYLAMAAAAAAQSSETAQADSPLPEGYSGYLGDPNGVLFKAHSKLGKQDPWVLSAEELFAVLRVLTDDILASKPEVAQDIENRKEEMVELHKAKRLADSKFRKVRLAFEGPKKPSKKKSPAGEANDDKSKTPSQETAANNNEGEEGKDDDDNNNGNSKNGNPAPFKPTATQKQFDTAKKAQERANDAYEKGLRNLVARTEPLGYDRNYNAVYCFRHDPEALYVELMKPPPPSSNDIPIPDEMKTKRSCWHTIDTKSLFDQYASSLDIRGKRENALYEELLGPQGAQQSLKRFLFDDIKEKKTAVARLQEKEDLKRRLDNARLKCDEEEGRRSGRLASRAEDELTQIEDELVKLEQKIKFEEECKGQPMDYEELTGLSLIRSFDFGGDKQTRRTTRSEQKEKQQKSVTKTLPRFKPCSNLCSTGKTDGTGVIGLLVLEMKSVEKLCESLVPWEREDMSRKEWISDLDSVIQIWNGMSPMVIGPADPSTPTLTSSPSGANAEGISPDFKRRKTDNGVSSALTTPQLSQIVSRLKSPLLDLEERVFELTGLSVASRDADIADDNMSDDGREDETDETEKENLLKIAWKKSIHKLRSIPTKRHALIREVVLEAISSARKAHLADIVAQLRGALLEYHPAAAGTCKKLAIQILDSHGGYEEDDDDADDDGESPDIIASATTGENEQQELPSALSADAIILNSSLEGMEDASRMDWKNAVKSSKTVSRIATLVTAFVRRATEKLEKLQVEHERLYDSLEYWEKEQKSSRKRGSSGGGKSKKSNAKKGPREEVWSPDQESSEVWANVVFTDEICMAKVEDPVEEYPWWPAKKCSAKDANMASDLKLLNRELVSLVGEKGSLRVVKKSDLRKFTGKAVEEDLSVFRKELRAQLDDCLAMSRRIIRGSQLNNSKKKESL